MTSKPSYKVEQILLNAIGENYKTRLQIITKKELGLDLSNLARCTQKPLLRSQIAEIYKYYDEVQNSLKTLHF